MTTRHSVSCQQPIHLQPHHEAVVVPQFKRPPVPLFNLPRVLREPRSRHQDRFCCRIILLDTQELSYRADVNLSGWVWTLAFDEIPVARLPPSDCDDVLPAVPSLLRQFHLITEPKPYLRNKLLEFPAVDVDQFGRMLPEILRKRPAHESRHLNNGRTSLGSVNVELSSRAPCSKKSYVRNPQVISPTKVKPARGSSSRTMQAARSPVARSAIIRHSFFGFLSLDRPDTAALRVARATPEGLTRLSPLPGNAPDHRSAAHGT